MFRKSKEQKKKEEATYRHTKKKKKKQTKKQTNKQTKSNILDKSMCKCTRTFSSFIYQTLYFGEKKFWLA